MSEEAKIYPDGSQEMPNTGGEIPMDEIPSDDGSTETILKSVDPAIYLIVAFVVVIIVLIYYNLRQKKDSTDSFFTELDGDKFNLKLPDEVEEYYTIKEKCLAAGWVPGESAPEGQGQQPNGPHRVMAQALMKRCIADIPIVTHIQKEATGMNKLYSQSMCSVNQWRAYQKAETLVSQEVEEVRAEADDIEPGWSQVIWRQAMQYHQMLKDKHEAEAKAAAEAAKKKREIELKVHSEQQKVDDVKAKELAAEKAAQELLEMEERRAAAESSKKAFTSGSGMKKGFLNGNKKK